MSSVACMSELSLRMRLGVTGGPVVSRVDESLMDASAT